MEDKTMDYDAGDLIIEGNNYFVQYTKNFKAYDKITDNDKNKCFDFAYDMSYGNIGKQRDSRSGGSVHRTKGQIFINTFQGKMAEFALYRFLENKKIQVNNPDWSIHKLGIWDSFDFECQGKIISVKSTKKYGNLLLLETKDWNDNGEYIPNLRNGKSKYDYTVLVRFNPDGERIMRDSGLLMQKDDDIQSEIKKLLIETICNKDWEYDFPGFIYYSELVKMIRQKRIIPKCAQLNKNAKMDAENYYFQVGNMHSIIEMYTREIKQETDDRFRFKRKCPMCGETLTLRQGDSWFWGCEGYKRGCRYNEQLEKYKANKI